MIGAVFAYVMFAAAAAMMLGLWIDDAPELIEQLGPEGKVVAVMGIGLLWPLLIVLGLAWLMRAAGRGVAQIARAVRPAKEEPLPKATARDK